MASKLFICLLLLLTTATALLAAPKYTKNGKTMTIVNDLITIEVNGNGLPRYTISSNSTSTYYVSFDSMYQVTSLSDATKKVGSDYSLSSYSWTLGDASVEGEMVSFSLVGTRASNPTVSFVNHVNSTSLGVKFDVEISDFSVAAWESTAAGLATCYTTKTKGRKSYTEEDATVDSSSNTQATFSGAEITIIPYASSANGQIAASLKKGDGKNRACIVYEKFSPATGIVHDPTFAVNSSPVVKTSMMVMIFCFLSIFSLL